MLLSLLSDLERAVGDGDSEQARPLLERLRDMLDDRASREERGVLTELRRAEVDDGYVALFEWDHTRLHELFEALEGPDWQTAGRPAMRAIRSARTSRRWTAARSETSELARGLELWEETVDELFDGEVTELAKHRAGLAAGAIATRATRHAAALGALSARRAG